MLRARDIMSKKVISVRKETPIFEAAELLMRNNISALPVVGDDMNLTGILSEKDVVVLFYETEKAEGRTVSDYMTYPAVCFDENEALQDVCDFFVRNIFRRVPITSKGKLVGIISIRDVLRSTLRLRWEKAGSIN